MRPLAALLIAAVAVLLASCGSEPTAPPTPSATTPEEASPTTAALADYSDEEVYGPRVELPGGLLLKQVGKLAEYGQPWAVRVVVEDIDVDPPCDHMSKPER